MRLKRLVAGVIVCAMGAVGVVEGLSSASDRTSLKIAVPQAASQKEAISWSGTIPAGTNQDGDCTTGLNEDRKVIDVVGADRKALTTTFDFSISWTAPSAEQADEILTVIGPDGRQVGSSDSASTHETVSGTDLKSGKYTVVACGFSNAAPQDYRGRVTVTTARADASAKLPSVPAHGLKFSASIAADIQRDEGEPLIEIDKAGRMYTCGPTGFSQASDYAQVSTDDGDQFHLLGAPPRGQQGTGGGGDCAMALAQDANDIEVDDEKSYNYAYSGLGGLTGFTTATSSDGGHTLASSPDNGSIPGVDRQWLTFLDKDTVLMNYNRQAPRSVEVIKSTNGGLTYLPPNGTNAETTPTSVDFPGPLKTLEAKYNWTGAKNGRVAYFPWTTDVSGGYEVNLAVSTDAGDTWKLCVAQKTTGDPSQSFPVADNDNQGNIYLTYTEAPEFHTYITTLKRDNLKKCTEPSGVLPTKNPGFTKPVQVDRDNVNTTLFPWLAASGKPGRVAVMFVGTKSEGDPNTGEFKASWNMYVNQSLNALNPDAGFSQVKVTTHPFHYDSICLNGLGCDISVPKGDRSLADFFAIDYNPKNHALAVVYVRANKKPDDEVGYIATPLVTRQIHGPSNGGGTVDVKGRKVVRTGSPDPAGDALINYSNFGASPGTQNEKAGDYLKASIGAPVNPANGKPSKDGGFTVTMKVADLSDEALQAALSDTGASKSLVWLFRFTNGYQDGGAQARWNPVQGFTFGFNDYTVPPKGECGPSDSDKCVIYPGDQPIDGKVDQKTGVIKLTVPLKYLKALKGSQGNGKRPKEVAAQPGSRLYDASAYSLANVLSPVQDVQSWLYPMDNTAPMDFKVPGGRVVTGLRKPLVKSHIANKTPVRGSKDRITARLAACVKFPGDKAKLAGTKVKFLRKKGTRWVVFARKTVNKRCKAHVTINTNFHKRRFRAAWHKQVKGYTSGHSKVRTIVTH
ncbi:MAG: hypothetical protein QOH90_1909 [Actinomycetota bacterium]|nr:hypothetical protein [Actinomycetota bacterium]